MSWTRRSFQKVTIGVIVVAWAVFWVVALATADQPPAPEGAVQVLVVPILLWVTAALLALHHWWSGSGSRMSKMDPPERLLTAGVAVLPECRRDWGRAMLAELAEVQGRSARWRFALSSLRATLSLPPGGSQPVLALVVGVVAALIIAAGSLVEAAMPELKVFAVSFTGLVGAMVVMAVARARRPQLPPPVPAVLVSGGVATSIVVTVWFLRREPSAAGHLPPGAEVLLAAGLAACLWVALAAPRWLGTNRLAPHLGAAAALVFAALFLLGTSIGNTDPASPLLMGLLLLLTLALLGATGVCFLLPAFAAAVLGRSFRAGVQAAVWTVISIIPLTYAFWLPEALRRYDGGVLLDGEPGAAGMNLADALAWLFGVVPLIGLPLGLIGAGVGALIARPRPPADPQPQPDAPRSVCSFPARAMEGSPRRGR